IRAEGPAFDCHPERGERAEGPAVDCHPERAERAEGSAVHLWQERNARPPMVRWFYVPRVANRLCRGHAVHAGVSSSGLALLPQQVRPRSLAAHADQPQRRAGAVGRLRLHDPLAAHHLAQCCYFLPELASADHEAALQRERRGRHIRPALEQRTATSPIHFSFWQQHHIVLDSASILPLPEYPPGKDKVRRHMQRIWLVIGYSILAACLLCGSSFAQGAKVLVGVTPLGSASALSPTAGRDRLVKSLNKQKNSQAEAVALDASADDEVSAGA